MYGSYPVFRLAPAEGSSFGHGTFTWALPLRSPAFHVISIAIHHHWI